jgi:hypothetical protein
VPAVKNLNRVFERKENYMSKMKFWMVAGLLAMAMTCVAQAGVSTVSFSPDIQGCVGANSGCVISGTLYDGNPAAPNHMFVTIEKFSLSGVSGTLQKAVLSGMISGSSTSYHFIVQHFTYDNSVALCAADASTTSVETISGVETPVVSQVYTWDVTSYVQQDIAAGYTHSGFRIVLTDASGTPVTSTGGVAGCLLWSAKDPLLTVQTTGASSSTSADVSGCVGANSGLAISGTLYDGNPATANHMFVTIEKFSLSSAPAAVQSAVLSSRISGLTLGSGYGFIVQHYTYDNSVALCAADATTTRVETISSVETAVESATYTWDVTSYVQQDIAAGYTHSAFRMVLTDLNGTPVTNTGGAAGCILWDAASPLLTVRSGTVSMTTYTYNSVISNWFTLIDQPAWTAEAVNGSYLNVDATLTNQIFVQNTNQDDNYSDLDQYAGAMWTVPEGERITQVDITYDGCYGACSSSPALYVLVGRTTPDTTLFTSPMVGDCRNNSQTASLVFDETNNYRVLQIRNWMTLLGTNRCDQSWWSRVTAVKIITVPDDSMAVSYGHRILITKGLQIQAMVFPRLEDNSQEVGFDVDQFIGANFTTANFWYNNDCNLYLGDVATCPNWSRITGTGTLDTDELIYANKMVSFQYHDEIDVSDTDCQNLASGWFGMVHSSYPGVIAYTNQYADQVSYADMQAYMLATSPDMVMFDRYSFNGSVVGGSPTGLYSEMQKYRRLGLKGNDGTSSEPIPYALYTQTYIVNGHTPSESELSLNEFAAWAFGYKFITAYTYDSPYSTAPGYTAFFTGLGDATPVTAKLNEITEINRQSLNLGPALVRLLSTDVRMIMGQNTSSGTYNTAPDGVTTVITGADDYLTGVSAENLGSCNNGLPGDVIVGFFKVLDESFDGTAYSNQKYFMVTNGLSDGSGSASATQQKIRLTFNMGSSGITSLQRLSRYNGKIEIVPLTSEGNGIYSLDLTLDGGTGDLFKYNTGAPFVAVDTLAGDFNGDGKVNATDIDLLSAAIKTTNPDSKFDLTGEGSVNSADMDYLIKTILHTYYGDADLNGSVGVSDLSVLAAYYNTASGASWANGDFDGNGAVGVSDLSILAANYNSGSASTISWAEAYAQAFGTTSDAETSSDEATADDSEDTGSTICSSLGLSLIAGLALMGLMIVKLEE